MTATPDTSGRSERPERVRLMGVDFDSVTEDEVLERIDRALDRESGGWIVTPNLEILRQAVHHPDRARLISEADVVVADGMPLVWAARIQGTPLPGRVPGSDLVWSVPALAERRGLPLYLLGGEPGSGGRPHVVDTAAAILRERYPQLVVAGTHCPPHGFERDPDRWRAVIEEVRAARPGVVFVALGFPKQEMLIQALREVLPHAWMLGLGISLSFVTGEVRRAPRVLQRLGLEWLHRFVQEPRRLARRYLLHGIPFAVRLLVGVAMVRARGPAGSTRA